MYLRRKSDLVDQVLWYSLSLTQHGQYFIVSNYFNNSFKLFDLEGRFISKFGKWERKDGEFIRPCYLPVNKKKDF